MTRVLRKRPNWRAPGPDIVQGYWLKNFTLLHDKLVVYLQDCLDSGVVHDWLKKGGTVVIQKDKVKGNIASNYWLITCLPLVWKLLPGILADKICEYLEKKMLLPLRNRSVNESVRGQVIYCLLTKWYFRGCEWERKT